MGIRGRRRGRGEPDYRGTVPGLDADSLRARLADARLYLCTDARRDRGDLAEFADAALAGGVDIVQLRDKGPDGPLEARDELAALEVLAEACARHGALLAVNDRADVALASGADVLHLGQDDLPVPWARKVVGDEVVIGRSAHSAAETAAAADEPGVDYFCAGPCWPTPTKPGRPAPGLDLVRTGAARPPARPWFAIGGSRRRRLDEVLAAGAERVVVVRAITEADDPRAAAAALVRAWAQRGGSPGGAAAFARINLSGAAFVPSEGATAVRPGGGTATLLLGAAVALAAVALCSSAPLGGSASASRARWTGSSSSSAPEPRPGTAELLSSSLSSELVASLVGSADSVSGRGRGLGRRLRAPRTAEHRAQRRAPGALRRRRDCSCSAASPSRARYP